MKETLISLLIIFCFGVLPTWAQEDDLESLLEEEMGPRREYVLGSYLSTYVMNNHSVEVLNRNGFNFRIAHKFGFLNTGAEGFYGFDHSSAFMGLEYAPTNWLNIGVGRATYRESVNSFAKIRLIRQSEGAASFPVTLVAFGELDYKTKSYINESIQKDWVGRIEYTSQLLIARKFGNVFSMQLMPGYLHRNMVETNEELNGIAFLGMGASYRLFKEFRLNAEYFWVQEHDTPALDFYSPLSLGICYQTSRHSFEVFATNSTGITSNNYIAYTTGNFWKGDICVAFNISIIFSVNK